VNCDTFIRCTIGFMPVRPLLPVSGLLLNALVWGLSWWPFRQLQELGWHPLWSTAFVYGFAVLVVCGVARLGALRGLLATPALWGLALASGLTNIGFNWAVTVGDVVRVVLLFYLMPAWSILLAWPLLGDKPNAERLLRVALAGVGVLLVLKTPQAAWPVPASLADWLALGAGACFALNNILLRKLAHTPSESRMLAMFVGGSTMSALAACLLPRVALPGALSHLGWVLALGLAIAFLLSNMALQYGAARLAAATTALVMLTEILFASGSSWLLGAAEITPRMLLGGALIIAAAAWAAARD
jgi:drug/metabolite transporter (DMT)-like permease